MPTLAQPLRPDDDGAVDPAVASALAGFQAGTANAADVLAALATARLFVPVVTLRGEQPHQAGGGEPEHEHACHGDHAGHDASGRKHDLAMPKLVGKDGRQAVLAFTGAEPLARWRADARPLQATGPQVCRTAREEQAAAVVVDVAGPVPFVIEGGMLRALAVVEEAKVDASALDRLMAELPEATVARLHDRPVRRWGRFWRRGSRA